MPEWTHVLRQFFPDPALVILLGVGIFVVLEVIARAVMHIHSRRSYIFVREQWSRSRHWKEYQALESQQVWHGNVYLPTLERPKELESLEEQQEIVRQ